MEFVYVFLAALLFAAGGFFMKNSNGASRLSPTLTFLLLFSIGALLQARAMRRADMGPVYIAVLGLEAALALGISVIVLHEALPWQRLLAVGLIVSGVVLLRRF
jgi:quaternary ammonium compound-resistance protein SugE